MTTNKNTNATTDRAIGTADAPLNPTLDLAVFTDADVSAVLDKPVTRAQIAARNDADGADVLMGLIISIAKSIKVRPVAQGGFDRTYGVCACDMDAQDARSEYSGKPGKAFYFRSGASIDVITVAGTSGKTPKATNVAKRLTSLRVSLCLSMLQCLAGSASALQSKADRTGDKRLSRKARSAGRQARNATVKAEAAKAKADAQASA